ncbi:MAG TPA: hypothetical protein VF282_09025 [Bacillota bacterium]
MRQRSRVWPTGILLLVVGATAATVLLVVLQVPVGELLRALVARSPADPPPRTRVMLAFAWPEYPYSVSVPTSRIPARWMNLADDRVPAVRPPDPRRFYWTLTVEQGDETRRWWVTRDGLAWLDGAMGDPQAGPTGAADLAAGLTDTPDVMAGPIDARSLLDALVPYIERIEHQVFGDLLEWPEADPLFPVGGTAQLRDVESRRSLWIRRHRGDAHFDVEPLTADDAAALKAIYGGEWSWKRRAAVLTAGGRRIAASMNGMPHGWGDIRDNDFPGHFCVHVAGSRVHTTWRRDPGHQLMVLKAAGRLAETLDTAPPEELVGLVLAALNHRETATLRVGVDGGDAERRRAGPDEVVLPPAGLLTDLLTEVRHLTVIDVGEEVVGDNLAIVRAAVTVYFHEPDRDQPFPVNLEVRLHRAAPGTPWIVELDSLAPLLEREQPDSTDPALSPDPPLTATCAPAAGAAAAPALARAVGVAAMSTAVP